MPRRVFYRYSVWLLDRNFIKQMDDIEAACGGNAEALGRLIAMHEAQVRRMLWRFTRDRNEWEMLVQETFVQMYYSLARYRREAPFANFLAKITTRVGYQYWKRIRRDNAREKEVLQHLQESWHRRRNAGVAAEVVHELFLMLAPDDRLLLTLVYLEGMNLREVAEITGWSESGMKMRTHRARQRLSRFAERHGIEAGDF